MKIIDPYASLLLHYHDDAVRAALQSNAAEYIRYAIVDHLADLDTEVGPTNDPYVRGMRFGLRLAFLAAGGQVDGSEQSWDDLVEEHRG